MVSIPSDDAPAAGSPPPAPLASDALAAVPGVLGRIARERAAAYAGQAPAYAGDAPAYAGDAPAYAGDAPAYAGDAPAYAGDAPAAPATVRVGPPERILDALRSTEVSVIAEVKRASPSQGPIADVDPVATARAYVAGGAAAVSVLTEPTHFGGALAHLAAVSSQVPVPTLRKDFVVHPAQIIEARAHGASAVLLIAAVLGDALERYLRFSRASGLDALVEVHDDAELEAAMRAGARLIGVNNRDLRTLAIDLETAPRLIAVGRASGHEAVWVAESGYGAAAGMAPLRGLADAVLIGTSLVRQGDAAAAVRAVVEAVG